MIASIRIFCRKRTTGASSTSLRDFGCSAAGVDVVGDVELEVADDSDSSALGRAGARGSRAACASLSCSTITHSGDSWVANLMRSAASWSVGSAPPMNRRLPRLPSTTIWYCDGELAVDEVARQLARVDRVEVEQRQGERGRTSVWARSAGDTAPAAMTAGDEADALSSARFGPALRRSWRSSLPAWTSTRATPERAECGARQGCPQRGEAVSHGGKRMIIADSPWAVNAAARRAAATIHAGRSSDAVTAPDAGAREGGWSG